MNKLVFILAVTSATVFGQSFRERTNEVVLDFSKPPVKSVLPVISWKSPAYEFSSSQENRISIDVSVSSGTPIKDITLQVIDSENSMLEKKIPVEANSYSRHIEQNINFLEGQHTVKLIVSNTTGGVVSSSRSLIIGKDAIADALSINRKDIALLFATDKYDYWSDLVNPVDDAHAIAEEIKARYGFEVEIVENATQEEVFIKLADYAQRSYRPQDQLMIFFAGHGYFDDTFGEGFVVARNSLENDRAKTTYISHSRLRSIIDNIPSEHILLVMDVCFGGTFDPLIARARSTDGTTTDEREFLVRKLSYKTRKYLTSGGKTYVSDGIPGKHSPFAQRMLHALKEGAGSDNILTLGELKLFVEKLIPEPRSGSFGSDNIASDFLFVMKQQ
jgi:hypothetical protein